VREEGTKGSVRNAGIAGNIDLVANAILAMENSFWVLAFVVSKWVCPVTATVKTAVQPGQSIPDSLEQVNSPATCPFFELTTLLKLFSFFIDYLSLINAYNNSLL
jgi:hypothetical protein